MNATGDRDIRHDDDRIKAQQEDELRPVPSPLILAVRGVVPGAAWALSRAHIRPGTFIPMGMNATGDRDIRHDDDRIKVQQEDERRPPLILAVRGVVPGAAWALSRAHTGPGTFSPQGDECHRRP